MSASELPPLEQLYFYLTEGCNLACRHCWIAPRLSPAPTRHAILPVELFQRAIAEARPLGLRRVKLTGGEPLLHPQFAELLAIVTREELGLAIETNGLLLTAELAAAIARHPQHSVSVSIDGMDAATHEGIRGVPGSFARVLEAVQHLVAAGSSPQIIMTLMRSNRGQVEQMVRLAERLGAGSLKLNMLQPIARGAALHAGDEALPIAELLELARLVEGDLARSTHVRLFFCYPPAFQPLSRLATGHASICQIRHILGVLADGHYALCGIGEHVPELVFGSVAQGSLTEIWQGSPLLRELRAGLPARLGGVCASCLLRDSCIGSCIAVNYYQARSLWEPFWFCREADEQGLFPASRRALARVLRVGGSQ